MIIVTGTCKYPFHSIHPNVHSLPLVIPPFTACRVRTGAHFPRVFQSRSWSRSWLLQWSYRSGEGKPVTSIHTHLGSVLKRCTIPFSAPGQGGKGIHPHSNISSHILQHPWISYLGTTLSLSLSPSLPSKARTSRHHFPPPQKKNNPMAHPSLHIIRSFLVLSPPLLPFTPCPTVPEEKREGREGWKMGRWMMDGWMCCHYFAPLFLLPFRRCCTRLLFLSHGS